MKVDFRRGAIGILVTLVGLAGCAPLDPEVREGEWHPSGANTTNLAAMVANAADLVHGVGVQSADGPEAAAAVLRLRAGKVKELPDSGLAELQLQSNGGSSASSGGN